MSFAINKCFFSFGYMVFKQNISIDPAPFWVNLFLYFFECKYRKSLISNGSSKAHKHHGISRFIDYLCAINDDNEVLTSFRNIYSTLTSSH